MNQIYRKLVYQIEKPSISLIVIVIFEKPGFSTDKPGFSSSVHGGHWYVKQLKTRAFPHISIRIQQYFRVVYPTTLRRVARATLVARFSHKLDAITLDSNVLFVKLLF